MCPLGAPFFWARPIGCKTYDNIFLLLNLLKEQKQPRFELGIEVDWNITIDQVYGSMASLAFIDDQLYSDLWQWPWNEFGDIKKNI